MSLNVIALISGGKDSIFSILHCQAQGHKIVALGNLYPSPLPSTSSATQDHDGDDPDSHMYQTAGHSLIPKIAKCAGLPLFRREIKGSNVSKSSTYQKPEEGEGQDETEDLDVLLKEVMAAHPEANAVSAGAILSTYQRTRIETVAIRLGLTPLAYLWQYPSLTEMEGEDALLKHMEVMAMEARIVKVASGGLDDGDLWTDVASARGREKIKKRIMRFGEGEGAVIGEGGEFETLVMDGGRAWKKRIVVLEEERMVVKGEGGTASLAFKLGGGKVVEKENEEEGQAMPKLPQPGLLDAKFRAILHSITHTESAPSTPSIASPPAISWPVNTTYTASSGPPRLDAVAAFTFTVTSTSMADLLTHLDSILPTYGSFNKELITHVVLLIRSMSSFPSMNTAYSTYFSHPNPPSRACVAIGDLMPEGLEVIMHVTATLSQPDRRSALHVQSRSYWAPANIGPYSQSQSSQLFWGCGWDEGGAAAISIAGQIPLVPATMQFSKEYEGKTWEKKFRFEAVLAAQHVWRIARAVTVQFLLSGTAVLPKSGPDEARTKAIICGSIWRRLHTKDLPVEDGEEDDEDVDLWELQNRHGSEQLGSSASTFSLPDWEVVDFRLSGRRQVDRKPEEISPFWAAEVESLPMGAGVEWVPGMGVRGSDWQSGIGLGLGHIRILPAIPMEDNIYVIRTLVGEQLLISTYFALYTPELEDWYSAIHYLRIASGLPLGENDDELADEDDYDWDAESTYVDVSAPVGDWLWEEVPAGVVPCRSLWDGDGRRLAAVCVFKDMVKPNGRRGERFLRAQMDVYPESEFMPWCAEEPSEEE